MQGPSPEEELALKIKQIRETVQKEINRVIQDEEWQAMTAKEKKIFKANQ